jgi:hypothetical protein
LARAQYNLAVAYDRGEGLPADDKEAVTWYRRAAEQGDPHAQYNLAVMYDEGEGVRQDDREAVKWYRKAAEQGDAAAQHNLGLMYAKGEGVPQDAVSAYLWLSLAVLHGYEDRLRFQDTLAGRLSPQELEEGRRLVKDWQARHAPAAAGR